MVPPCVFTITFQRKPGSQGSTGSNSKRTLHLHQLKPRLLSPRPEVAASHFYQCITEHFISKCIWLRLRPMTTEDIYRSLGGIPRTTQDFRFCNQEDMNGPAMPPLIDHFLAVQGAQEPGSKPLARPFSATLRCTQKCSRPLRGSWQPPLQSDVMGHI